MINFKIYAKNVLFFRISTKSNFNFKTCAEMVEECDDLK
jgi:hypothetical protein